MALTEKISAQNKIAELEDRIVRLEKEVKALRDKQIGTTVKTMFTPEAEDHWKRMWKHFDLLTKGVFK